jgi:GrpB-like predicted nucleotidyltransferase (UPF0157 family)
MLAEYDRRWPEQFRVAADEIRRGVNDQWVIEHIGSTAVPRLAAKPIIDLAIRIDQPADVDTHEDSLAKIGFFRNHGGPRTHPVFVRWSGTRRSHIAHFFTPTQWEACNQRIFRDWLLTHPDDRIRYQQAKENAAATAHGRDYTAGKTAVIQEIVNRARNALGLPQVHVWEK